MRTPESLNTPLTRKLVAGATVLAASLTLASCDWGDPSYRSQIEKNKPGDRYAYDYGQSYQTDVGHVKTGCLDGTAYDSARVEVTFENSRDKEAIAVSPVGQSLPTLHFMGIDNEELPLQPSDTYTNKILKSAGCDLGEDNSLPTNGGIL